MLCADGAWSVSLQRVSFYGEKRAWLDQVPGVTLGSDAFFSFSDNIVERAHKSGVQYIAEPADPVRDEDVHRMHNMVIVAFTGIRPFHH